MIKFNNINVSAPYKNFKKYYKEDLKKNQKFIEAIAISSYDSLLNEVDSRFVNLKYIDGEDWIFFTNYSSPKSIQFESNNQVACIFFWDSINVQIRIKAKINRLDATISDKYFKNREKHKNALAISSYQSKEINSYQAIVDRYNSVLENNHDLTKRPSFWGGYSMKPYLFEFWEGHSSRLNKRVCYKKNKSKWDKFFLQP